MRLICLLFLFFCSTNAFSVNRTWVGIGAGGAGTDFNNVANWTGGGALAAGDNFTMTLTVTSTYTINVTANITVNDLTFVMNTPSVAGVPKGTLNVGAFTLTVNGTATFNAIRFTSPMRWEEAYLNINTGGTVIFNGNVNFHTTGSGDTYLTTNFLAGGGATTGTVYFNGSNITIGLWGRTVGLYEPNIIFNRAGAQTVVFKCNGSAYMFKAQDLTFGTTNAPIVTIRGPKAIWFDTYDGNMTIAANTTVIIPDTSAWTIGSTGTGMCYLKRFSSGGGTFTMGSNAVLNMGAPNNWNGSMAQAAINGFATYSFNSTSTISYNSSGWQDMLPITYGNLICDGLGNPAWKYSNGAQTVAGNFTVQGSTIYGPWSAGGLTINGTTLLQTSGVFNATRDNSISGITHTFKGDLTNNSTWTNGSTPGINTALFNSTTLNQIIGGTTATTFWHLTINNTSGLGVTLAQNENVSQPAGVGVLTLTNGALFLNSFRLTVQNAAIAAITRTGGRVVSENNVAVNPSILQWNIGATTGAHVFPFGTAGGSYLPVTFNNSGAVGNVSIATRPTVNACAAPVGVNGTCNQPWAGASNVAAVSSMGCPALGGDCSIYSAVDRFWDITSSSASPLASAVTLSLTYMGAENTITTPGQTLGFQHWNGSLWNAGTAAGTAAGTYVSSGSAGQTTAGTPYTVTGSGFVYFSPYILVGTNPDVPLPVELLSFTADCKSDKVIAEWETASEQNADYFTLEKSLDGNIFYPVTTVKAAGSSSTIKKYSAEDVEPFSAASYYRLSETDFNGATETFNMIAVRGCGNEGLAVYPNPASGNFNVSVSGKQGDNILIVVKDLLGREFYSQVILLSSDDTETIAIDPSGKLTAGVYFVAATSNDAIYKKKLVIK